MTKMITAKDEELIAQLRLNARIPVSALARKLGVSRTTVQDRLARLEREGIIEGYDVRLAAKFDEGMIRAFVTLGVEPSLTQKVMQGLMTMPGVTTLSTVSGKFDLIAQVQAQSSEKMDQLLDDMGALQGVIRTESAIILSTKLDRR